MATSSRPFQSQTVARLVAGYRQVAHGAGRWLRQGRTVAVQGAVWGLQVAIYPIYAAVQGVRLGYRRLRASPLGQQTWAKLVGSSPPELVEADTPIRALLSVIQPPTLSSSISKSISPVRSGGLRLVNRHGRWLRQSQAGAILTPGQWHLLPLRATVRGVATDLATRQLVLVTADNDIFDALTDDQQHRLRQAIALMVAEYARGCHQFWLKQHLQQPGLPLPQPQPTLFLPLRWLPNGLRWMQTSALAAVTNLFGEAAQQREIQTICRQGSSPSKPGAAPRAKLPAVFSGAVPDLYLATPPSELPPATLTATTSVAEAVALVLASSGAVAATLSPEISPHADAVDLATSGGQVTSLPATRQAGGMPTTGVHPPLEALAKPDQPLLDDPNALEVKVVQVNYVDHPLVVLLRGLDWLLYELEIWLRRLGAWLRQHW